MNNIDLNSNLELRTNENFYIPVKELIKSVKGVDIILPKGEAVNDPYRGIQYFNRIIIDEHNSVFRHSSDPKDDYVAVLIGNFNGSNKFEVLYHPDGPKYACRLKHNSIMIIYKYKFNSLLYEINSSIQNDKRCEPYEIYCFNKMYYGKNHILLLKSNYVIVNIYGLTPTSSDTVLDEFYY